MDLPRLSSPALPALPDKGDPGEFAAMCYATRAAARQCQEVLADYNRYADQVERIGEP